MITIKDFMECVDYKISDGSEYMWECYGRNARAMSYENGEFDAPVTIYIVFDTQTQFVYEMQAWDGPNRREYRWIHPGYIEGHATEAANRDVDYYESFDHNKFIDLEVAEDILEKATAIANGEEYDDRIIVQLTLEDDEKMVLMSIAHEHDMSLNQFVEYILQEAADRL